MMDGFTAFDALVLALVALLGLMGLARGFVGEVASLGAWVAGMLAVRFFHEPGKALMMGVVEGETLAAGLALLILFFGAFVLVRLLGAAVSQRTRSSVIGPVDRILGLGFGLAKGVVAAVLLFLLTSMGLEIIAKPDGQPLWFRESRSAPVLAIFSRALVDFVDEQRHMEGHFNGQDDPHAGLGLPGLEPRGAPGGYDQQQRSALDKLLREQEQQTPSTPI